VVQPRHHNNPNLLTRWTRMLAAPSGDWSVFQQIFAEHWEAVQHAHPRYQTPYYHGLVGKMRACGNPAKSGYMEYRCLHCGQGKHVVAMRCKSSLCLRCATVAVDNWVSQVSRVLHEGVISRHLILTVPAMFRTPLYQNAAVVLRALRRCGAPCLDDFSSTVKGKALKGGLHHGAPHAWPPWAISSPSACACHQWRLGCPGSALGASPVLALRPATSHMAMALTAHVA
jgi:hypothetical protein